MLSIGGADPTQTDPWSTPENTNLNGIGVFELVAESWSAGYNASAEAYQRSSTVQRYYDEKYVFYLLSPLYPRPTAF